MRVRTETRLGILLPNGQIEKILGDPETILEATLSVAEYAGFRATALGGKVVKRTRTITTSGWSEWKE